MQTNNMACAQHKTTLQDPAIGVAGLTTDTVGVIAATVAVSLFLL
jgi:hypothetical protein